jgi:hypothetical protein
LHWAVPDAARESVRIRPGTGPPLAEDTRTMGEVRGIGSQIQLDHPLRSGSVTEFWGRQWNIAFREIFTAAVLLIPLCFLFHPPFVERIMVPFMRALGAA